MTTQLSVDTEGLRQAVVHLEHAASRLSDSPSDTVLVGLPTLAAGGSPVESEFRRVMVAWVQHALDTLGMLRHEAEFLAQGTRSAIAQFEESERMNMGGH